MKFIVRDYKNSTPRAELKITKLQQLCIQNLEAWIEPTPDGEVIITVSEPFKIQPRAFPEFGWVITRKEEEVKSES